MRRAIDGHETPSEHRSRIRIARLLRNPATPIKRVLEHVEHPDPLLRAAVAANPSVPERVLFRLALDLDEGVRWEATLNPSAPLEVVILAYTRNGWAIPGDVSGGLLARRERERDPTWEPSHWYW